MCRSIKTLREPYTEQVTEQDVRAAALQYVRKISGFRAPAAHNAEAFNAAVDAVSRALRLELRLGDDTGGISQVTDGARRGRGRGSRPGSAAVTAGPWSSRA